MPIILGLSGSLREHSYNTALLRAAAALSPPGTPVEIASIRGIPLYDADAVARDGDPPAVRQLKDRIAAADGLLLVTPEYNNSMPGVFKNAIDHLSTPPQDGHRVFRDRRVALMGATPGPGGTLLSQSAWLQVLRALGVHLWPGRLMVSGAGKVFDAQGNLVDERVRAQLEGFMAGFAEFAGSR